MNSNGNAGVVFYSVAILKKAGISPGLGNIIFMVFYLLGSLTPMCMT